MTSDLLDDRLRSAAVALHREASVRQLPELPAPRSTTRRTVVVAFAAIAVLLIGLIVIGNRQDVPPAGPDDDLHWILDGWTPVGIRGPGTEVPSYGNELIRSVFGTATGIDGPVVVVTKNLQDQGLASSPTDSPLAKNFVERTIDGVDVVLADVPSGVRFGWATYDGDWVSIQSRHLGDDEIFDIAGHLVFAADGTADIAPEHGPDLTRFAAGPWSTLLPIMWAGLDAQGTQPGIISIDFEAPSGQGIAELIVSRSPDAQLAQWSLLGEVSAHTVDGIRVWERSQPTNDVHEVGWKDGDHVLFLSGPLSVDLVSLVPSVRVASPSAWSELVQSVGVTDGPADTAPPSGTFVPDEGASADTVPPPEVSAVSGDVDLDWSLSDVHPNDLTMSVTLPNGHESSVDVAVVAGSARISTPNGSSSFPWGDDAEEFFGPVTQTALVFTHDQDVAFLRARLADGSRVTVPVVQLSGVPGLSFAVIAVDDQFVSADLLDADRNVLRSIDRP